jgi:type II secretory pathway pseudopilin PulG
LAEVLITLGIIGIAAALILPGLIQDRQNKQFAVGFKKVYRNMSNAVINYKLENGCEENVTECIKSYSGKDNDCNSFTPIAAILNASRITGDELPDVSYNYYGEPLTERDYGLTNKNVHPNSCLYRLPDGMILSIDVDPNAFRIAVDVNGKKLPNRIGKDVHGIFIGQYTAGLNADIYPVISAGSNSSVLKGLCYQYNNLNYASDNVNPKNGCANPMAYILLHGNIPDFKEIASKVPGFKP